MSSVFVFSGTSEGRELCEKLASAGILCHVFVATEYGQAVMKKDANLKVSVKRLDSEEIENKIKELKPEFILDATHPHAVEVTDNILSACKVLNMQEKYIRVSRNISDLSQCANENMDYESSNSSDLVEEKQTNKTKKSNERTIIVHSTDEAVNAVKSMPGRILLTTGVKELSLFCRENIAERLVVRILPGKESITEALSCNIPSKRIIAMEGPFSTEMNVALIKQYEIGLLVTKNSGSRGGFAEKIKACEETGISVVIIDKPSEDKGISIDEAVSKVKKQLNISDSDEVKDISLVGAGVCNKDYLLNIAHKAIKDAELIIGAQRMIEFGKSINSSADFISEYKADNILQIIKNTEAKRICILFSGDTGLCSGAKGVKAEIERAGIKADLKLIPGVSSISYFSSKIGIQYSDYPFISLHGRDADYSEVLHREGGFFAICSGKEDVEKVFNECKKYHVFVGKNLGSEDEEVFEADEKKVEALSQGLFVVMVMIQQS